MFVPKDRNDFTV